MAEAARPSASHPVRKDVVRAAVAATIGNGIEWFDYISFAFFTPYLAQAFFPKSDPTISLILTWATYAIGIVVRPVAGAILGVYGDRIGRRRVLSGIILAMALGILIIAVTPTYAQIGVAAPLLVIAARILQGVSATGEYSSGISFLVEYAPPHRRYLFGSFQYISQAMATVLGTFAAFAVTKWLSGQEVAGWGWRIPFLLGVLVGPIGFYIRRSVGEAPEYVDAEERHHGLRHVPWGEFLRHNWWGILSTMSVVIPGTVAVYLWFLYGPGYAIRELHLDAASVNLNAAFVNIGLMILVPISGALCDRFGGWRMYVPATIALGVTAYPLFLWMNAAPSVERFLVAQLVAMVIKAGLDGASATIAANAFPTGLRSSGLGFAVNLAIALFGGLAPLIVVSLIASTGDKLIPAYYMMGAVVIALVLMAIVGFGRMAAASVARQGELT